MLLQWATLNRSEPQVRWGLQPGIDEWTVASNVSTYARGDMCGAPANASGWSDPGLLHQALLTGLQPGTRYYYIVGDPVSFCTSGLSCSALFSEVHQYCYRRHLTLFLMNSAIQKCVVNQWSYIHTQWSLLNAEQLSLQARSQYSSCSCIYCGQCQRSPEAVRWCRPMVLQRRAAF